MPQSASTQRARGVPLAVDLATPVGSIATPAATDCEYKSKMQDDGRPGLVTEVSACMRAGSTVCIVRDRVRR